MSNTYGQHLNIFTKYFERPMQDVNEQAMMLCQVVLDDQRIEARSSMIRRLIYSSQKVKNGKADENSLALIEARAGRLKTINSGLLESIVHTYNLEKESTMATCVNLSAHLLDAQKRDQAFWEEVITTTGSMSMPLAD